MKKTLRQTLIEKGWTELQADYKYRKDNWLFIRDTSSWWIVETDSNPRVFDIHEPAEYELNWTANLIEHLCKMDDERNRLRKTLEQIQNSTKELATSKLSKIALDKCYHSWLVKDGKMHCSVCHLTKENINEPT